VRRFLVRWRHWLLLALGLGVLGAFMAFNLVQERARMETIERERLTAQSKVIDENLSRQLIAINLAMESLVTEQTYWATQADGQARAIRRLTSMEKSMPSVRTFGLMDAEGTITSSNRQELVGRNFAQREYFQVHARSKNPLLLHVSDPFVSVLNNFVINLSRAIISPNGEFLGVVLATVDPIDIQILLNSVRYADDMRSMLVHGNGKIFVSQPALPGVIGKDVSGPGTFFTQHLQSRRAFSSYLGQAPSTGDQRLTVLHTIQPKQLAMDKPLVVSISRGTDAMFVPWQTSLHTQLLLYLVFALLCTVSLFLYERHRTQQRAITQRLRLATEAAGVGIWEFEPGSRKYHWDAAMFTLFGLRPDSASALNEEWKKLLLPGEIDRIRSATRAVIQHRQPFDLTFQIRHPQGHVRFLRNRAALHVADPDAPLRLIGTTEDVTERKLREADLSIAAAAFECQESIVVTDAQQQILRVNHAFTELFGYTAHDVLGATPRLLKSGRHAPAFYAALWADLARDGAWQGEIWDRRKNGEGFPVWLSVTAVRNTEGELTHYVATHTDITLRKAAEAEIHQLAFFDPLTGLANRRLLQDRLRQAVTQAARERRRLALLFIDLDQFKPLNDTFGHQAGDELLQAVAQRLQSCVRESDTVARPGGDEFVLLLTRVEAAQDAMAVAQKVQQSLRQPFDLSGGQRVHVSSSTGVAVYPEHGGDDTELMRHADEAMYEAKAAGRDRFVLFTPACVPARPPTPAAGGRAPPTGAST